MKFKILRFSFFTSALLLLGANSLTSAFAQTFNEQKIVQVSTFCTGYHTMALDDAGHVWTWGFNSFGQIGDPNATSGTGAFVETPYMIQSTVLFKKVAAAYTNSFAIDENDQLWGWGSNAANQLTIADKTVVQKEPYKILEGTKIVDVFPGKDFVYALDNAGKYWAWGQNNSGQLGTNEGVARVNPIEFQILDENSNPVQIQKICPSDAHVNALDVSGNIWAWGNFTYTRLGFVATANQLTPVKLALTYNDDSPVTFSDLSAGQQHSLAIDSQGNIWSWGKNSFGQLGDGTSNLSDRTGFAAAQVTTGKTYASVFTGYLYSFAYDSNGKLYAFGYNNNASLDILGITGNEPVLVPTLVERYNYSNITNGALFRFYLDENGGLWGWGSNNYGQLTGTQNPVAEPMLLNPGATTAVSDLEVNTLKIYGVNGNIVIDNKGNQPVSYKIYNFAGSLVKQGNVSPGENRIPISNGLYIITAGGASEKVYIK